ncbi:MAG: NAD(P)-dependent oxidoreductase [Pirellulaceae bacterium]|nr:NAD(P)-dependent oxidoreductase [Pirellulaceae bacterium]
MERVGIIGLGLVGSALAERLLAAGYDVHGFDSRAAKNETLSRLGGQPLKSAAEVAKSCETLLLSLPTSDIAAAVIEEVKPLLSGKTVLDTTTGQPETMASMGRQLADIGCDYLDATIAGSSSQVRSGDMVVMLGGTDGAAAKCESLLTALAKQWFHLGPWGAGARMKLVVNLVLGLNRAVLAEGLSFAKSIGVEPRQALEVLMAGPAFARVMETKGEKMLTRDFTPQARLAQHHKDVMLILEEAARANLELPLSSLHEVLLARLVAAGDGDLDNSAILKAFQ